MKNSKWSNSYKERGGEKYKYYLNKNSPSLLEDCIPKLELLRYNYKIKYSTKKRIPNSLIIIIDLKKTNLADSIISLLNSTLVANSKNGKYRICAKSYGFFDQENSKYSKYYIPVSYVNSIAYSIDFILGRIKKLFTLYALLL